MYTYGMSMMYVHCILWLYNVQCVYRTNPRSLYPIWLLMWNIIVLLSRFVLWLYLVWCFAIEVDMFSQCFQCVLFHVLVSEDLNDMLTIQYISTHAPVRFSQPLAQTISQSLLDWRLRRPPTQVYIEPMST